MDSRPPAPSDPPPPVEPRASVSRHDEDTTVVNVGPPPRTPAEGRPPRAPWPMIALVSVLIVGGLLWWLAAQSREQTAVSATATATTVVQATATTDPALVSQQAAAASQATSTAQSAGVAVATATAQAAALTEARSTAQAVSAQATTAAAATAAVPTPVPQPPATPVVVVVTATAPPPPPPAPAAPAPPPPVAAVPAPPVPPPSNQQPARVDDRAPTPVATGGQAPAPAASPVGGPRTAAPASATTTEGEPLELRYLGERVRLSADPDVLPPDLTLTARPVEAGTVPQPPGPIMNEIIFRLEAQPASGTALPAPVTLELSYAAGAAAGEQGRPVLGYFDGQRWAPVPEQSVDTAATRVSADVARTGVYALYRAP